MYLRSDERGPQMNNRLALRLALFGGFALVLFAVLFFRLWHLQVLSGEEYLVEANNNRIREFRVSAPRGEILDRNGKVLVGNRTSLALQVNPQKLPADLAERRAELARLGELTHTSLRQVRRTIAERAEGGGGRPGHPAPRRRRLPRLLPAGEPGPLPGGRGRSASSSAATRTGRSPPTSSATSARSARSS